MKIWVALVCLVFVSGCGREKHSNAGAVSIAPMSDERMVRIAALSHVASFVKSYPIVLRDADCLDALRKAGFPVIDGSVTRVSAGERVCILKIGFCELDGQSAKVAISASFGSTGVEGYHMSLEKRGAAWFVTSFRSQGLAATEPNKAPEPTPGAVTSRAPACPSSVTCFAGARLAPAPGVAHL